MTDEEIRKTEQELYAARGKRERERQEAEFTRAVSRCKELVQQRYWKRTIQSYRMYEALEVVSLFRVASLAPCWFGTLYGDGGVRGAELKIEGRVENLMIPILPTLITAAPGGNTDSRARGLCSPMVELNVKRMTKKEAEGRVPCWVRTDTMVVPLTISAAPTLAFHEPITFFDGLVPSTESEFKTGLSLILNFVVAAQKAFPGEPKP